MLDKGFTSGDLYDELDAKSFKGYREAELRDELKPEYYIFGIDVCTAFETGGEEGLTNAIEELNYPYALHKFTPGESADQLLDAMDGWGAHALITKEFYEKIL